MPERLPEYCGMALSTRRAHSSPTGSPVIVGLTGSMGAGKSVVAAILRCLGFPVYDADGAAKRLYVTDAAVGKAVRDRFGEDVFNSEGVLVRKKLADRVFGDDDAVAALNEIVHPAVRRDFDAWKARWSSRNVRYLFREAAILFESGAHVDCDRVWSVTAPEQVRMSRVKRRNGWTLEEFKDRTRHQWAPERVNAASDSVIVNDGFDALVPVVVNLIAEMQGSGNDSMRPSSRQ